MFEKIIELNGKQKGATSMILVGIHGDEKCGVEALKKILTTIKIERGRVFFGYGNPMAIKANKRFTEANLNRMFKQDNLISKKDKKSYEYNRAQFLKKYLDKSSALLDVHASFTPKSKPFVICENNARKIAKFLPVNLVVSGFDKVEPGGTDFYMNSIGKIGICVECGYLGNSSSFRMAEKSIFNFLKARGHIANNIKTRKQSYIKIYDIYTTKTNNFTLSKVFKDFENIRKDKIIGIDGTKEVKTQKDSVILFARNVEKVGEEAFLLGKKKTASRNFLRKAVDVKRRTIS